MNILTTNVEKKTYISGGKTKGIAFAAAFGALMAATGGFSIPLIVIPVPITFQVFFVYLNRGISERDQHELKTATSHFSCHPDHPRPPLSDPYFPE